MFYTLWLLFNLRNVVDTFFNNNIRTLTVLSATIDKRRKSALWNFFTKKDNHLATCNICQKDFSYKGTITNLRKHLIHRHSEGAMEKDENSDSEIESGKTNLIWSCFTKKDSTMATCNACHKEYSYRFSTSNLRKHWRERHVKDGVDDNSDTDLEEMSPQKLSPTWKYFEVPDPDTFVANCKVCDREVPFESVSDLTRHIRDHNVAISDSDVEDIGDKRSQNRRVSVAWQFFECVDKQAKLAKCLICQKQFSFNSSVSNLLKHVRRSHPAYKINDGTDEVNTKTVMISSDGQVYEVDDAKHAETEDEKDPMEMDAIYLEDLDDLQNGISPKKLKTNLQNHNLKMTPVKRKINKREQLQVPNTRLRNTRIFSNRSNNSSDDDTRDRKPSKSESLNYFGKYVVSLLSDLPKHVSEQLQGDIIKQIITTKVALQSNSECSTSSEVYKNLVSTEVTVTTDTDINGVSTNDTNGSCT
ncbi:uncharacterized protein LOC113507243 isoform X3 [Trichoplusia ni]|uniref:Uncharacterized protein LOC113507243 isoform X3 n=1 Tax=Trichoplusia ni TaxID=7111 RepID=A0A7E5X0G4_TRINI|nr:uncharacterized protein LOC113507243 isoform X3 [Trichoplusia ni]